MMNDSESAALERQRIRAKYAQRHHERRIDLYFKALEIVRAREEGATETAAVFSVNFATSVSHLSFTLNRCCLPACSTGKPSLFAEMLQSWEPGMHRRE